LLTRKDVIIVATVSCIYGLGSPVEYEKVNMRIEKGMKISRAEFIRKLIDIHYEAYHGDLESGTFRALGNSIEIMPVSDTVIYRIELSENTIESITKIDAITREIIEEINSFFLFPAKHFITDPSQLERAVKGIKEELKERLDEFKKKAKFLKQNA
jgi:excinuclease ABC subunit B